MQPSEHHSRARYFVSKGGRLQAAYVCDSTVISVRTFTFSIVSYLAVLIIGVIMKFENETDLSEYVSAPAHVAYAKDTAEQTLGTIDSTTT